MKEAIMYTDGSCHGNPGPGGYAAILMLDGVTREVHGGAKRTTNNRMELRAVIEGLRLLTQPTRVTIVTDSRYVADRINGGIGYMESFAYTPGRKNAGMWQEVLRLMRYHHIRARWIRGHSGNKLNQRCDSLANMEAEKRHGRRESYTLERERMLWQDWDG